MGGCAALWLVPAASATNYTKKDRSAASVSIVHGIPGAVVDVCAKGDITGGAYTKVITDFEFTQIEKLRLPAGKYDARVVLKGEDCANPATPLDGLSAMGLDVSAGADISIIANLKTDGKFTLTVGVNDTSKLDKGKARVTAYHAADAPAVDILAAARDSSNKAIAGYGPFGPVFAGVMNGQSGAAVVDANRYKIAIAPAGAGADAAVKTVRTKLKHNRNTIVYAVGSLADKTFTVLKQSIKVDRGSYMGHGQSDHGDGDSAESAKYEGKKQKTHSKSKKHSKSRR